MASEDLEKTSRVKSILPVNSRIGKPREWSTSRSPTRKGGLD